jgi:hypothetical protein
MALFETVLPEVLKSEAGMLAKRVEAGARLRALH